MNAPLRTESGFPRKPQDAYDTPPDEVRDLVPYLSGHRAYAEPCAGSGSLIEGLRRHAPHMHCAWAGDLHPRMKHGCVTADAAEIVLPDYVTGAISNPPWPHAGREGDPAISIILNLCRQRETWMLLPFVFAANRYFARVAPHCFAILPIGRPSWEGNGVSGKKDCAWFGFRPVHVGAPVVLPRGDAAILSGGAG